MGFEINGSTVVLLAGYRDYAVRFAVGAFCADVARVIGGEPLRRVESASGQRSVIVVKTASPTGACWEHGETYQRVVRDDVLHIAASQVGGGNGPMDDTPPRRTFGR